MAHTKKKLDTLGRRLPYIFLIAATIGLISSFALTYDKIHYLKNPAYVPACDINPILSCGSVMKTQQADLLGLPNTVFGIAGFSILFFVGLMLVTGSKLSKRLWQLLNLGILTGFLFFIYLFFQGVYRINAICPYCFLVWLVMPPLLLYITLYNLQSGNISLGFGQKAKSYLARYHWEILTAWYVIFFGILLTHFWYYWKTLI